MANLLSYSQRIIPKPGSSSFPSKMPSMTKSCYFHLVSVNLACPVCPCHFLSFRGDCIVSSFSPLSSGLPSAIRAVILKRELDHLSSLVKLPSPSRSGHRLHKWRWSHLRFDPGLPGNAFHYLMHQKWLVVARTFCGCSCFCDLVYDVLSAFARFSPPLWSICTYWTSRIPQLFLPSPQWIPL